MIPAAVLKQLHRSKQPWAKILTAVLTGTSWFYMLAIAIRELAFTRRYLRIRKLPAPVVSVGNITTGGTGKTPMVAWLAQSLPKIADLTPVILSRGYGEDEIRLLEEMLPCVPHIIGKDRFRSGLKAMEQYGRRIVFLLDDGFQHRRLARDMDIVLVDATDPFGLGHVLPRGFLREPIAHLRRAHVVVLTRCDQAGAATVDILSEQIQRIAEKSLQVRASHVPARIRQLGNGIAQSPEALQGRYVFLFAGIGNPLSFTRTVSDLGPTIVGERYFPDHYRYRKEDLLDLDQAAKAARAECLLTTAKDAVKLAQFHCPSLPVWILDVEMKMEEGENLLKTALERVAKEYISQEGK